MLVFLFHLIHREAATPDCLHQEGAGAPGQAHQLLRLVQRHAERLLAQHRLARSKELSGQGEVCLQNRVQLVDQEMHSNSVDHTVLMAPT